MLNFQVSKEELEWIKMALETVISNRVDSIDWFTSQGQWQDVEKQKEIIAKHRKLLERAEVLSQ